MRGATTPPPARPLRPRAAARPPPRGVAAGAAARIAGVGASVPPAVLTNDDLAALGLETNDEWFRQRTGIRERHILSPGESLTDHAAAASTAALEMAGVPAAAIDVVILATSSPDDLFGSATGVAAAIGAKSAVAFDITAACSGFVVGLVTATQFVRAGGARNVLVIGADALSRYIDWRDRGTCILFGDGAGAVVVSADANASPDQCALRGFKMASDGVGLKHLNAPFACAGGKASGPAPSAMGAYANIAMNGQEVFKFAVRAVPTVLEAALADANLPPSSIDWLVLHQANQRILDAAASRLGVPPERVVSNLARYGNTSAASIPLALNEAVRGGDIKAGDTLAVAGFGAGLTWAGAIVRWG